MRRKGLTKIELLVVVAAIVLLMVVTIVLVSPRVRLRSYRIGCRSNLKGIGKAMLQYCQGNDGSFPVAGGPGACWSTLGAVNNIGWLKGWPEERTFGAPGRNKATVTSCFYLLVRYRMAETKQFVCRGDEAMVSRLSLFKIAPPSIYDTWDFSDGAQHCPGKFCSYSYHMPFAVADLREGREDQVRNFAINQKSADESPVCADRNPFLDEHLASSEPAIDDNCYAHGGKGQNVLYRDMHVDFEKSPLVGIGQDNIWAHHDGKADQAPQFVGDDGPPSDACDAYLVNEYQDRTF